MAESHTEKWNYRSEQEPPPLRAGDWVVPRPASGYPGWAGLEPRQIEAVVFENRSYRFGPKKGRWRYRIANHISPKGYSLYNPGNMLLVEGPNMGYERTKYAALKMRPDGTINIAFVPDTSDWYDSALQVQKEISNVIAPGERWLVIKTVAMIEGEEPRPPMKITEYK